MDDGGPAFPVGGRVGHQVDNGCGDRYFVPSTAGSPGMSLRDYFAAKAMATLAAALLEDIHHEASGDSQATTIRVILDEEWIDDVSLGEIARTSYDLADAMLRARNRSVLAKAEETT